MKNNQLGQATNKTKTILSKLKMAKLSQSEDKFSKFNLIS